MFYLKILNSLSTPIWIFDIDNKSLVWGNTKSAELWSAESVAALINRDFKSDMSLATELRLGSYKEDFQKGIIRTEQWTFYPGGLKPMPVVITCSGIRVTRLEGQHFFNETAMSNWPIDQTERLLMLVEAQYLADTNVDQNKEWLRSVEAIRHTPVMISLFELEGTLLIHNPSAIEAFGHTCTLSSIFADPSDALTVVNHLQDNNIFQGEMKMRTKSGVFWHHIDARTTRDPVTAKRVVVINQNNIHDMKLYHQTVKENERRLQEAQEVGNMGSWELDLKNNVTKASKQFYRIMGLEQTHAEWDYQHTFMDLMNKGLLEDWFSVLKKAIEKKESKFEYSHLVKNTQRYVHVRGEVEFDDDGTTPIKVYGTTQDITEIQAAKDKLEQERKFVEALIGCLKAGIVACNSQGEITHFNKSAQKLHGLELKDGVNEVNLLDSIRECYRVPGSNKSLMKEDIPILRVLSGESITDRELILVPQNNNNNSNNNSSNNSKENKDIDKTNNSTEKEEVKNNEYIVLVSGQEIVSSDGSIIGAVIVLHDISDRKADEEELRKAIKAAQEANQIKNEFLANISHELLSPMNSIVGMSGLALDVAPPNIKDMLSDVVESSKILLHLLHQILDFTSLEDNQTVLRRYPFKLRDTIRSVLKIFYPRILEQQIVLRCKIDPSIPDQLFGDQNRLKQILANIIDNAIKFSNHKNSSNQILINVIQVIESNNNNSDSTITLQFSIQDNGIGVPVEKSKFIFDGFYQVDGSYSRTRGGVGIGLSICHKLVKFFNGKIWFDSQHDKGSTFYFTINIDTCDSHSPLSTPPITSTPHYFTPPISPRSVSPNHTCLFSSSKNEIFISPQLFKDFAGNFNINNPSSTSSCDRSFSPLSSNLSTPSPIYPLSAGSCNISPAETSSSNSSTNISPNVTNDFSELRLSSDSDSSSSYEHKEDKMSRRVLVAEDNTMNQRLIQKLLSKRGFNVSIANDGKEALQLYEKEIEKHNPFDCILMDIQMPVLNGLETTSAIRERERQEGGHTPIIAVTAHAMKGDKEKFIEAGVDDYVTKPINPNILYQVINSQLK